MWGQRGGEGAQTSRGQVCGRDGKGLVHLLFFDITCEYSSYFVFVLDLLLKHLFNEIHLISVRGA